MAASRIIIQKSARWKVGDGLHIKIWGDSWLPRENLYKVLRPRLMGVHPCLTVRSLMVDLNGLQWNTNLFRSWFMKEETNKVAHRLARFSLTLDYPISWFEEPPDVISDFLLEDSISS